MKKYIILLIFTYIAFLPVSSQTVREQVLNPVTNSAGTSMAYKYTPHSYTPAPDGYTPFYINHVGRHGSRNHTAEKLFPNLASILNQADKENLLTEKGKELKCRIDTINGYMYKRYGDLTRVGAREHEEIASRMFENFPEVFNAENKACIIDAKSTLVPRCILSMSYFGLKLKEKNPSISLNMESSDYNNSYLNFYSQEYREYYDDGTWRETYNNFREIMLNPERLVSSLFKERLPSKLKSRKNFMTDLWSATAIMGATDINISLYDMFTEEEIYALWQVQNLNQYLRKGPSGTNGNIAITIAKPMLQNFLETSQYAIKDGNISTNLRFAHAEGVIPFAALMGIENASKIEPNPDKVYQAWNDFKVAPMGANIQWIFYKNGQEDIIVKILLNEQEVRIPVKSDIAPYYKWEDVLKYYNKIL